ncbi:unnamed protein product, partial [Amoebophrya sp. A120]
EQAADFEFDWPRWQAVADRFEDAGTPATSYASGKHEYYGSSWCSFADTTISSP